MKCDRQINIRLPTEMMERLQAEADAKAISTSALVRQIIILAYRDETSGNVM